MADRPCLVLLVVVLVVVVVVVVLLALLVRGPALEGQTPSLDSLQRVTLSVRPQARRADATVRDVDLVERREVEDRRDRVQASVAVLVGVVCLLQDIYWA